MQARTVGIHHCGPTRSLLLYIPKQLSWNQILYQLFVIYTDNLKLKWNSFQSFLELTTLRNGKCRSNYVDYSKPLWYAMGWSIVGAIECNAIWVLIHIEIEKNILDEELEDSNKGYVFKIKHEFIVIRKESNRKKKSQSCHREYIHLAHGYVEIRKRVLRSFL